MNNQNKLKKKIIIPAISVAAIIGCTILTVAALSLPINKYQPATIPTINITSIVKEPYTPEVAPIPETPTPIIEEVVTVDVETASSYKVENGDSFWSMADKLYGDGELFDELAEANGMRYTDTIYPGQEIVAPESLDNYVLTKYTSPGTTPAVEYIDDSAQIVSGVVTPGSRTSNGDILDIYIQTMTYVEDTSNMEFLGNYFITGYAPTCAHCCSKSNGITASGELATIDRTISMKNLPFGTEVYIEGYGFYVVEDRGVGGGVIDIARLTHEDCGTVTKHDIPVYIVN